MTSTELIGAIIFFGILTIIVESILRFFGYRLRKWRDTAQSRMTEDDRIDTISLQYFRGIQRLAIARFWIYVSFIVLASLMYDIHTFSYIAVVAGGLIITFKEAVVSFASYFLISSNYEIGDDIKIKDSLGEIIRIRPLSTSILGKEDNGDHNGKLIVVPNYLFSTEVVEKQELKRDNYRMIKLTIMYDRPLYSVPFEDFFVQFKAFLDENLPKRTALHVGHYKTFSGMRYKMIYDYDDSGRVLIKVRFISAPAHAGEHKERIISFVESLKA